MTLEVPDLNPSLDLKVERGVDVPPSLIWKCWTEPEHLVPWFTPKPWQTTACEIDLRPGGRFYSEMKGPNGEVFTNVGCYLEVMVNQKLTWTNALMPGFRPAIKEEAHGCGDFFFTAMVFMRPEGSGARYTAIALHNSEADTQQHRDMGFEEGWGTVLTQLVEYAKSL